MRTCRPDWRKNACWNAMKSGASPTPGVSATLITLLASLKVGVAVDELLPVHPATVSRPATRAVMLARARTGRPVLRWSTVRPPIGTSLTGTPRARIRTVADSSKHAAAQQSTLLPVAGRANVRYISFFLVMRELLSVGRLGAMVSPESRCPRRARTMSPAEGVRHVGSAATSAGPRAGYGTEGRGPHTLRSRSNKNPDGGTLAEGEQADASSAFGNAAVSPESRNGQNGHAASPDDLGAGGVPQPEAPPVRPPSRHGLKNWRVRSRLLLLITIPTLTAVALGGFRITSSVQSALADQRTLQLANLSSNITTLVQRLNGERDQTAYFIAEGHNGGRAVAATRGAAGLQVVYAQRHDTERAAAVVTADLNQIGGSFPVLVRQEAT